MSGAPSPLMSSTTPSVICKGKYWGGGQPTTAGAVDENRISRCGNVDAASCHQVKNVHVSIAVEVLDKQRVVGAALVG